MSKIFTIDFTKSFIDELASYIEREYIDKGRALDKLAIVFGGKRPAYFLKRALAKRIGRAFIPPRFFTVNELIDEMAAMTGKRECATSIEDAFEIYCLAQQLTPELLAGRASFAKFLPWAMDILNFIGQLDIEAIEPSALKNVQQSARIGYPVPENINQLLEKIGHLRQAFHARLQMRQGSSRGLQYLRAKDNVALWAAAQGVCYDEIIFANFFYFHQTEEAVVQHLYKAGKATLIFQGDQTKWPVLERIARKFGCEIKEGAGGPVPTDFELKAYAAGDAHAQAVTVRDILGTLPQLDNTLVVVPDPAALVPLLSALPEEIQNINVSMGYPLKRSSLYLLLRALFEAHTSRRDDTYYAQSYLSVMTHPFVRHLHLGADERIMPVLTRQIEEVIKGRLSGEISGRTFIGLDAIESERAVVASTLESLAGQGVMVTAREITDVLKESHDLLWRLWAGFKDLRTLAEGLDHFLDVLAQKSPMPQHQLNGNITERLRSWCASFRQASFADEPFSMEDMGHIFEDSMGVEVVRFQGTPLKGLQILGLEETRSLNFEHVIVMDVNEGVLPNINVHASLIPREVMIQLKLDRLELEEEIQRYQFMRVISSAKTVHLVYQKNKEKEPSRFVEELVWAAQQKAGKLAPYPTQRGGFTAGAGANMRMAAKTPQLIAWLKDFTYSASAINAYLANPYTFYTSYVLGLREEEDLLDEPDAALIGNFFHQFLDDVYRPFEGKALELGDAFEKRLWGLFETKFEETFLQRMRSDAFLVRKVMEHKLRAFLVKERERAPSIARIMGLEKDLSSIIELPSGAVKFKARLDRIEQGSGGGLLVLDYKTGGSDKLPQKPVVLSDACDRREIFDKVRSFQLPLYMHMVAETFQEQNVNGGLYSLRDAEIGYVFTDRFPQQEAGVFLKPFYVALDHLMREIFDPEKPFLDDELRKFDF
ncbi:MAG: exodeoxyribonuclease V subunit gamma [Candidatus Omnitrophica bacterium]|nr:exodeoxyribonuclease V subunit gamma [Candidatus Omnitrophota bacterium]